MNPLLTKYKFQFQYIWAKISWNYLCEAPVVAPEGKKPGKSGGGEAKKVHAKCSPEAAKQMKQVGRESIEISNILDIPTRVNIQRQAEDQPQEHPGHTAQGTHWKTS